MTADAIAVALRQHLPEREWALLFEVGNATGHNCRRHADAVGMSLWPSRGFELHGFEFKCSKTDLKREVENPEKADAVGKFCDHWWVVVSDPKVLEGIEVPAAWGIMVLEEGAIVRKRHAKVLEAQPITRGFVAALLRRASETHNRLTNEAAQALRWKVEREQQEAFKARKQDTSALDALQQLQNVVATFERETGLHVSRFDWQTRKLAEQIKLVGILENLHLGDKAESLRRAAENVEKVCAAMDALRAKQVPV